MLKIGLTGGIGSGKSTIANIFSTLGIPVYDADKAAKKLMKTHEAIRKKMVEAFGEQTYKNGQLDRAYIASLVFNNTENLKILNSITHPVTIQDAQDWFSQQKTPYAIKEAALIFESGSERHLDYIIGVWAPVELRLKRTLQRGGITEQQAKDRMRNQMNESKKMELCDFVIDNSGIKSVVLQVYDLHNQLENLAASSI